MKNRNWHKYIFTFFIGIYACLSLYPLVWMVFQSLKNDLEFYQNQYSVPLPPRFINYLSAWEKANFAIYYKNSILVTGLSLLIGILVCALASYAFSKINFIGKKLLNFLLVVVLFLPSSMLVFPNYLLCRDMGLLNKYSGLIGPYVCGMIPISMLILIGAFNSIPNALSEAAKLDGCNDYYVWWKIMMPLVRPSIATVAILGFVSIWSEFMWALVSVNDKDMFTLPIGIVDISSKIFTYGYGPVFAGMVMATLPIILFYIVLQEQFVKAVAAGAVKG